MYMSGAWDKLFDLVGNSVFPVRMAELDSPTKNKPRGRSSVDIKFKYLYAFSHLVLISLPVRVLCIII